MTDSQRIKEIEKYTKLSTRALALEIELKSPQTLYDIHRGRHGISKSLAAAIQAKYQDINFEWLMTGDGLMLKDDETLIPPKEQGIPFYDIDVTASITESFHDEPELAQYYINYPPLNDCTAAFPVYGDSMIPDFCAGEVVLVREIKNIDSMLWGEPYLIITNAICDNLRTIKKVFLSPDRKLSCLLRYHPHSTSPIPTPM